MFSQSSSRLPETYLEKFTFTKAIDSTSYQVKCNTCDKDLTVSKGSYKSINKHLTTCKKRKLSDSSTSCKKIPVLVSLTQKQQQFNSALLDFIVKDSSYVPLSMLTERASKRSLLNYCQPLIYLQDVQFAVGWKNGLLRSI